MSSESHDVPRVQGGPNEGHGGSNAESNMINGQHARTCDHSMLEILNHHAISHDLSKLGDIRHVISESQLTSIDTIC